MVFPLYSWFSWLLSVFLLFWIWLNFSLCVYFCRNGLFVCRTGILSYFGFWLVCAPYFGQILALVAFVCLLGLDFRSFLYVLSSFWIGFSCALLVFSVVYRFSMLSLGFPCFDWFCTVFGALIFRLFCVSDFFFSWFSHVVFGFLGCLSVFFRCIRFSLLLCLIWFYVFAGIWIFVLMDLDGVGVLFCVLECYFETFFIVCVLCFWFGCGLFWTSLVCSIFSFGLALWLFLLCWNSFLENLVLQVLRIGNVLLLLLHFSVKQDVFL